MKKWVSTLLVTGLVVLGGYMLLSQFYPQMDLAWAQGWGRGGGGCPMRYSGRAGGGDYQPRGFYGRAPAPGQQAPATNLTQERARDIASGYLAPGATLGQGRDGGAYYEFEVRHQDKVVDRLAVEKSTGLVRPLN